MKEEKTPRTYLEGKIKKATWEVSLREDTNKPYIKIAIETKETPPRILYRAYPVIIPLLPGMMSPMAYLEEITNTKIKVPASGKIKIGDEIPELAGIEVTLELEDLPIEDKWYPWIAKILPKKN